MQRTQQQFAANQVNGWISLHLFEGPTQTAHVSSAQPKPPPPLSLGCHCGFGRSRDTFFLIKPTYSRLWSSRYTDGEKQQLPRTSRSQKKNENGSGKKKKGRNPRRTSPPTINPPNQERSFLQKTTKTLESPQTFVRLPSANASVEHWHLSPCPLFFGVSWGSAVNDVWVILEIWPPPKKRKNVLKNIFQSSTSNFFCKWFGRMSSFFLCLSTNVLLCFLFLIFQHLPRGAN